MNSEKHILLFLLVALLLFNRCLLVAQEKRMITEPVLSSADQAALRQLPELGIAQLNYKADLPYALNNATQPYFRPLFEQISIECGQYSGIAFNFCYEMNYSRKTPANVPENQYPTHYTFNFMNGGFGWQGVSYEHSFEIAKANGHPNEADYGGINAGGVSRWVSGYEKYYHGMSNKIDEVYQIQVGTPEGLLVFKNWLHNHLTGEEVGGIASFYSPSPWNATTLPPGTPEGGKYVIPLFAGAIGHASTITGYNDSIRYDYNQDGQYTNDMDINGDSIIDMKDWEIGGLLFTDSYIGGNTWADSGFCYMMYRTLAENGNAGGIWNHAVHVLTVKKEYEPLLTYKIKLRHSCRKTLKVMAGVSSNPEDTFPAYTLELPIFDYQGGCQYMQGGWDADSISLEFGLDVTPLLAHINKTEASRFFLLIDENDPPGYGSGAIENFSLMDYTLSGGQEIPCPISNVALNNNTLTTISLTASIAYNKLEIVDTYLPMALTNEPYVHQMQAQGGKQPYTWEMARHYDLAATMESFPEINGEALILDDTLHGMAMLKLDFPFPFYGKTYDTVWVHSDGFILFDDQTYPWPYNHDEHLLLRKTRCIAPYLNLGLFISSLADNAITVETNTEYAAFHWKMSAPKPNADNIEFEMKLFPGGEIECFYTSGDIFLEPYWASGISNGDEINFVDSDKEIKNLSPGDFKITLIPQAFPSELNLSNEGLLSGTTTHNHEGEGVDFIVRDANNLMVRKTLSFSSYVAGFNENRHLEQNVKIFPNPSKGIIHLEFTLNENALVCWQLRDQNGKFLFDIYEGNLVAGTHKIKHVFKHGDQLQPGIYFLQCTINGETAVTRKFIRLD